MRSMAQRGLTIVDSTIVLALIGALMAFVLLLI